MENDNLSSAILDITKYNSNYIVNGDSIAKMAASAGGSLASNFIGVNPVSFTTNSTLQETFSTTPFKNLYRPVGEFADFRSRLGDTFGQSVAKARKDGTYATFNISARSLAYSLASMSPLGAYSVFNLNAGGKRGYGWGDHSNGGIFTADFTLQSLVATKWDSTTLEGSWKPKIRNQLVPFRGDRVNVIDYGQRTLKQAYLWKPSFFAKPPNILGALNPNITQDFIKFFFTGPKLHNGSTEKDDIIVFRATISSMEDSFSGNWTENRMIGRADANYTYSGFSRDMSLSFTVFATDRDELKPIWRKLNALAGYTAPTYDPNSIGLVGPWMRITIGDLLVQQPIIIDSVGYTLMDQDTTWEINIEGDPEMKQVPHKISVSVRFKVITDYLPQKNGQFYTLAAINDANGSKSHTTSWLTDPNNTEIKRRIAAGQANGIIKPTFMDLLKLGVE